MAILRKSIFSAFARVLSSNRTGHPSLQRPLLGSVPRFYSSNGESQSQVIDLGDIESRRRLYNRLLYRSKQRGCLELDLILGNWVEYNVRRMNGKGIEFLIQLLDQMSAECRNFPTLCSSFRLISTLPFRACYNRNHLQETPDLWTWLSGQEEPPEAVSKNPVFEAVHKEVAEKLKNHAAPGTRATPGQPWVRGWDDFKKGRDSPIAGNQ